MAEERLLCERGFDNLSLRTAPLKRNPSSRKPARKLVCLFSRLFSLLLDGCSTIWHSFFDHPLEPALHQAKLQSWRLAAVFIQKVSLIPFLTAATLQTSAVPQIPRQEGASLWTPLLGVLSAALAFITAVMLYKNERWKKKYVESEDVISKLTSRVKLLEDFASTCYSTTYIDTDLLFLGPRGHGKTSVVTAMTKQWKPIHDIRPTPVDFLASAWELPIYEDKEFLDGEIGLTRTNRIRDRIVVYDYAGEDQTIPKALEQLASSAKSIVMFVLSAEPHPPTQSSAYFNVNTLRRMRKSLAEDTIGSCTAFILFSKQDLTSYSSTADPSEIAPELLAAHAEAVENIRVIFGEVPKYMVSSETGYGISYCLRDLLSGILSVGTH
jgi:hypothetical protein